MREHPQHHLEAINYSLVQLRIRLKRLDSQTSNGSLEVEREKIKEAIRLGEKVLADSKGEYK